MPTRPRPPADLPRHRNGVAPQMRSRYPDWNVLDQADRWDEGTRRLVLARVRETPPIRFFDAAQEATLRAFVDTAMAQDCEPRIPVLEAIDARLHDGRGFGYRFEALPSDGELWRLLARALDEEAQRRGRARFCDLAPEDREEVVAAFAKATVGGGSWERVAVDLAWRVVMRDVLTAYYAHPWSWNEIGFAGPAYPRGFTRFGADERETWERPEELELDPVADVRERTLDR